MIANKEKKFVSAVIYIHNAEKRVEDFLRMVIGALETNFEHSEIICVNDYSNDQSVNIIKKISDETKTTCVSILNMSHFHGLEVAMNAGVNLAIGDYVFEFDTVIKDYEDDMIMKVYERCLEGYDVVSASPHHKTSAFSKFFYRVFMRYSDTHCIMNTENFRILSRRIINRTEAMNTSVVYRKVLYVGSGLKTDCIKYDPTNSIKYITDSKEKKYRSSLAMDSLILFTQIGYRFSIAMTFLMILVAVGMIGYTVFIYCTAKPVEGWTTTVLFLATAFFGLFGIMTVVIKYLQLIIKMVFNRSHFSFESIEKLSKR